MSSSPPESLKPPSITTFKDLASRFPGAELINHPPQTEYSIPLPSQAILVLSRHISSTYPGQEKINPSLALPCLGSNEASSRWTTDRPGKSFSAFPRTIFGFKLDWLKAGGYQKILESLTSTDFSQLSKELHSHRQLAMDTVSLLVDPSFNQSFDDVYDQGYLYLCSTTKSSRRQSHDGFKISFFPSGIVSVYKGLYNPKKNTFRPKQPYPYLFGGAFQIGDSPQEIARWLGSQVNTHQEVSSDLKKIIPIISPDQL